MSSKKNVVKTKPPDVTMKSSSGSKNGKQKALSQNKKKFAGKKIIWLDPEVLKHAITKEKVSKERDKLSSSKSIVKLASVEQELKGQPKNVSTAESVQIEYENAAENTVEIELFSDDRNDQTIYETNVDQDVTKDVQTGSGEPFVIEEVSIEQLAQDPYLRIDESQTDEELSTPRRKRKSKPIKFFDDEDYGSKNVDPVLKRAKIVEERLKTDSKKSLAPSENKDVSTVKKKGRGRPRKAQKDVEKRTCDYEEDNNETILNSSHEVTTQIKEEPLTCQTCNKVFRNDKLLQRHTEIFHKEIADKDKDGLLHQCNYAGCEGSFKTLKALKQHQSCTGHYQNEHEEESNIVSEEDEYVPLPSESPNNSQDENDNPEVVQSSSRTTKKKKKTGRHSKVPIHQCPYCDRKFKRRYVMNYHINAKHPTVSDDEEGAGGDIDHEGMPTLAKVKKVRRKPKVKVNKEKFKCTFEHCAKSFTSVAYLKSHEMTHTGEKPYVCQYCDKKFTQKGNRDTHELIHKGIKPHACKVCDRAFTQLSGLKYHERSHIKDGNKRYFCDQCGKGYSSSLALNFHKNKHANRRPYQCEICGRSYADPSSCRRHMKYHEGPTIQCEYCTKLFYTKTNLMAHMHNHTGLKKFQCETCANRFTSKAKLREHELIHTGERPFSCPICTRSFIQKVNMLGHVRKVHGCDPLRVRVTKLDTEDNMLAYKCELKDTVEEAQAGRFKDIRGSRLNHLEKDDSEYKFFSGSQKPHKHKKSKLNFKVKKVQQNRTEEVITFKVTASNNKAPRVEVAEESIEEELMQIEEVGDPDTYEVIKQEHFEDEENAGMIIEQDGAVVELANVQYEEVVLPVPNSRNEGKPPVIYVLESNQGQQTFTPQQAKIHVNNKGSKHLSYLNVTNDMQLAELGEANLANGNVVFLEEMPEGLDGDIVYEEEVVESFPPQVAQEEMVYTDSQSEYVDMANTVPMPAGNAVVMLDGRMIGKLT